MRVSVVGSFLQPVHGAHALYRASYGTLSTPTSKKPLGATLGQEKRHLAIKTKDPARLAKFYEEVFGLKVIHTERSGAVYMSDGYLTLALLRNRGEATPSGINHFGFQVDDVDDVEQKLKAFEEPLTRRPSTRPFAEHRAMDPDGNLFDISAHGYDDIEFAADRDEKKKKAAEKATA